MGRARQPGGHYSPCDGTQLAVHDGRNAGRPARPKYWKPNGRTFTVLCDFIGARNGGREGVSGRGRGPSSRVGRGESFLESLPERRAAERVRARRITTKPARFKCLTSRFATRLAMKELAIALSLAPLKWQRERDRVGKVARVGGRQLVGVGHGRR